MFPLKNIDANFELYSRFKKKTSLYILHPQGESEKMSTKENTDDIGPKLKTVLAEYNDCRDEIKTRIQQRTRMTEFSILGLAAITGFAIQSGNYSVMSVAPAYTVFIYAMIINTYFYTDSLAHYIREEIELKKIPHILRKVPSMNFLGEKTTHDWETRWLGWEINYERCLRKRNPLSRKKILHFFSLGLRKFKTT